MATTLDQLVQRTRRFMRDYHAPVSALSISLAANTTSITVADTTVFAANTVIEVDYETMLVGTLPSGTVANVTRGFAGTTAATHTVSTGVNIRPAYYAQEVIDALNAAKDEMWPYVYKPVLDTSLTVLSNIYEYTVPNMPSTSVPIGAISKVEVKVAGDYAYRPVQNWQVRRGTTPVIQFKAVPPVGATIRVEGFGVFPDLALVGDTVDALFPHQAERLLPLGAAVELLGSGEAGRSRFDVGARDDREAANRAGGAIGLANQLERRFEKKLSRVGMPPMPRHVVSVF